MGTIDEKIAINPTYNKFVMGQQYVLKITPMVIYNNEMVEIETENIEFTLEELKNPRIGLKMSRETLKQDNNEINYIKVTTTIQDSDAIVYGSEYGEYEIHVYRYTGSTPDYTEQNEVAIYTSPIGGTNLKGSTFDINNYGTNFSVYVQQDSVDYKQYSYITVIKMKYDTMNNGTLEDHEERYTINRIENEEGVSIGSTVLVQDNGVCEMRFYDSYYNITKIDRISYTMYNLTNNEIQNNSFTPDWKQVEDAESGVTYYKVILPAAFTTSGTYTIQMNLYVGNNIVGTINNTTYISKG